MSEQIFVNDVLFPVCLSSKVLLVFLLMFKITQNGAMRGTFEKLTVNYKT